MPINIIVADDHKIFREGIVSLLSKEEDLHILADSGDEKEILTLIDQNPVDLILMDIDMGETSGIDLTKTIKASHSHINILALSMHGEKNYIIKMMEAGAKGYILKNAGKEEMINAIKSVAQGNTYLSSQVSEQLFQAITNPKPLKKQPAKDGTLPLTDREKDVLRLIAEEYSNPEIAEKLYISTRTVDTHRRNLLQKLQVKNTAGLVKYALKMGLLDN